MAWRPHGGGVDPAAYLSPVALLAIADSLWPALHRATETLYPYAVAAAVIAAIAAGSVLAWLVWGPLPERRGRTRP